MATLAPTAAKFFATPRLMPLPPPVTKTVLPLKRSFVKYRVINTVSASFPACCGHHCAPRRYQSYFPQLLSSSSAAGGQCLNLSEGWAETKCDALSTSNEARRAKTFDFELSAKIRRNAGRSSTTPHILRR